MKYLAEKILAGLLLSLALTNPSFAGSTQREDAYLPLDDITVISKKIERIAAEKGARVFLMARVGRPADELPPGVEYTHVSFAVYSIIATEDGRTVPGFAVYNLYQRSDEPTRSDLVVDFPIDFMAGARELKVGMLIPTPALQKRLLQVIGSDTYSKLHNSQYSAISNPYNQKYQNCTEHVLDVINAAIYQTDDIEQLKVNSRKYFTAQPLQISPVKLFFGSMFLSEIKTSDQKGAIQSATFGTIRNYLEDNGLVQEVITVEL